MSRLLIVALSFFSGTVALSHELLWTRRLIDLLGATDWVTGRVLGLFFLGLSLGGWLATRWAKAESPAATRLGIAEWMIAILSVPAMLLPLWADSIVSSIGVDALISWQGSAIKFLLSLAVVLPPAIAMGTTMPLFIRAAVQQGQTVQGAGIWIYSLNMLGGVFGLWMTSTFLLDSFGVLGTMLLLAAGNAAIGIGALLIGRLANEVPAKLQYKATN